MFSNEFMITVQTTDLYELKTIELFLLEHQLSFKKESFSQNETSYIIRSGSLMFTSNDAQKDFVNTLYNFFKDFKHLTPIIEGMVHNVEEDSY